MYLNKLLFLTRLLTNQECPLIFLTRWKSIVENIIKRVYPESIEFIKSFTLKVQEEDIDNTHQAQSDGDVVKGEYRTLLPDGRTQIVRYTADWKNGYNAEVCEL